MPREEAATERMALFLPVERRVLSTAGTLQSLLCELFDEPIDVKVRGQEQGEGRIHREVDLRGRVSGRVACYAVSDLTVDDAEIRAHILDGRLGLGQILAVLGRHSTFQFEDVGRENGRFWRRYSLSGEGFSFSIREAFPDVFRSR